MPGMGGLDMLKEIMRRYRLPVIVVSSHSTEGASVTFKALSMGAFDFVAKPRDVSARMPEIARELIGKDQGGGTEPGSTYSCCLREHYRQVDKIAARFEKTAYTICGNWCFHRRAAGIAICAVTISGEISGSIVSFNTCRKVLQKCLRAGSMRICAMKVKEAQSGDLLLPGRVLICPGQSAYQGEAVAAGKCCCTR